MTTSGNVVVFGSADANTMVQARDVASRAERVALMADNYFGYIMPPVVARAARGRRAGEPQQLAFTPNRGGGMTAATRRYLGARTPFGTVTSISGGVYNPEATVEARDGSTARYRLPFLIAHGARPAAQVAA